MEFLPQQNRRNEGDTRALLESMIAAASILATGKRVIIIGGGDTGADSLVPAYGHIAARRSRLGIQRNEFLHHNHHR